MSVRNQSQDQIANRSTYTPSGGSHLMLHRAVVASTSLLAMAAALGWSDPALAVPACGPATSGVPVNCGAGPFAGGIIYAGPADVDDLTLNVGSFAGVNSAITVGGDGIYAAISGAGAITQTVNVGKSVTITTAGADGIKVEAGSDTYAIASVTNKGAISTIGAVGIYAGTSAYGYSVKASTTVSNSGTVAGMDGSIEAGFAMGADKSAKGTAKVTNSGYLYAFGPGIGVQGSAKAWETGVNSSASSTVSVSNKGNIVSKYYNGIGISSYAYTKADNTNTAASTATTTLTNSGKIASGIPGLGGGYAAIGSETTAQSGYYHSYGQTYLAKKGSATATSTITNKGKLITQPEGAGIESATYADSYGLKSAKSSATGSITNSGGIATTGSTGAHEAPGLAEQVGSYARSYDGGPASATGNASITNSGKISTAGGFAPGIVATSNVYAGGYVPGGHQDGSGTANSTASVTNSGALTTVGSYAAPGIYASASSRAAGLNSASAYSDATVVNSGKISTATLSPGIYAYGYSVAGSFKASTSTANAGVTNKGAIATSGASSPGIYAKSAAKIFAYGGGTASATSSVANSGKINTVGDTAPGIYATSYAKVFSYLAATTNATSTVSNSASITTAGVRSAGIASVAYGYVSSEGNATSNASSSVSNSGAITTTGDGAFGIASEGTFYAKSFGGSTGSATASVTNSGNVTTAGLDTDAIIAGSGGRAYSAGVASATASSSVVNSGDLKTTGATGFVYGTHPSGTTTKYYDAGASGIEATSRVIAGSGYKSATASATSYAGNKGAITTSGNFAYGIYVTSLAAASPNAKHDGTATAASTADNAGAINVSGNGAQGIAALSNAYGGVGVSAYGPAPASKIGSASATTTVNNSGAITTTGGMSYHAKYNAATTSTVKTYVAPDGIYATSYSVGAGTDGAKSYGTTSVSNSGAIKTSSALANGIYAASTGIALGTKLGDTFGAAYTTVQNSGAITVTGDAAQGIDATSTADSGIQFTSAGPEPSGANYGRAKAITTVDNSAAISTTTGVAVYGSAYSVAEGVAGARSAGTVNIDNSGALKTTGYSTAAIRGVAFAVGEAEGGFSTGGAYVNIVNGGAITTKGVKSDGIYALTTGVGYSNYKGYGYSVDSVTNGGAIKTVGALADGIHDEAKGSSDGFFGSTYTSATVVNAGSISTKGAGAVGIYALGGDIAAGLLAGPYANATVINTGDVTTTGAGAAGIVAVGSTDAAGAYVYSAARSTVTSTGAIKTSGAGAAGIYSLTLSHAATPATAAGDANGKTYAASTVTNAGSISTIGDGAPGIGAISKSGSYAVYDATAISASTVTNAGSITTAGAASHGIASASYAVAGTGTATGDDSIAKASSTVTNVGSISVSGAGTNGILAAAFAIGSGNKKGVTGTATTMVTNAGSIVSSNGYGIQAYSHAYANSKAGGVASTTVINAGSVSATGVDQVGVFAASTAANKAGAVGASATLVNAAGGTISASGKGGIGAKVEGAYATTVTYAGSSIVGGKGAGAVGVYENGAASIVSNGGSIASANNHAVSLNGLYYAVLTNTGTVTGYATLTTTQKSTAKIAGAVAFLNYGTWVAVGGNTTLSHVVGGASSNLVNEASGEIVVVGNQTFTADTFTSLGLITMQQSATVGLGTRPAFETLTVSGDFTGVGGTLAVDGSTVGGMQGDVLKVKGAITGGTGIKPTIVGTPGATTGNGILVAEGHSVTGAGNFTLDGNADNGHAEVAGAFEYNLDFVPGSGTSGAWYLQSSVFPGVSQFGQIGSASTVVADQVNVSLDQLMGEHTGSSNHTALNDDASMQVASTDNTFVPSPNGPGLSGWGRYDESRFNIDPSGSKFADYKLRVDTAQFGGDYDWHNAWNEVVVGGYVAPFHSFADFNAFGTEIGTNGTNYALYGLWFNGPWEAGLRLNYADIGAHISDTFLGTNASVKPNERGVQAAAQYDMPFDWGDFTPSGEVNYGTTDAVKFTDGVGDLVNVSSTNDFWGKINGRFSTDVTTDRGLLVQPYANIGLLYRGDTSTKVGISGFSTSTNINGWNADFAVGVNTNLMAKLSLSAQVDYLAGSRVEGWTGFLGLRYTP